MRHLVLIVLLTTIIAFPSIVAADTVFISPSKDNTLYNNTLFPLSNALGFHFFAGQTLSPSFSLRRGLIAFDIASAIPAGAKISSVELTCNMSKTSNFSNIVITLHRVLSDWGEGTSNALANEGGGASATPGDATWLHTFFDTGFWATPGGDFVPIPSASGSVGGLGPYTWDDSEMEDDVQLWLDNPSTNFGWLLLGDESTAPTSKRFDSKDHPTAAVRPLLRVDFDLVVPTEEVTWGAIKSMMADD